MSKKQHCEEHEEHADETWLVPYADVLTLLLALFIVLFAMSQVDAQKFEQMAQSFKSAFNDGMGVLTGSSQVMPLTVPKPSPPSPNPSNDSKKSYEAESEQLSNLKSQLDKYINENKFSMQIDTKLTDEGLVLIMREAMFFGSGSAVLLPASYPVANKIATMLTTINQKVVVSGHTDNIPINTAEFPSNWDLSTKRAVNFMKYMLSHEPLLRPDRFSATGYGEFQPIASNLTETGRRQNRRVEVVIMRNYPKYNEHFPDPDGGYEY